MSVENENQDEQEETQVNTANDSTSSDAQSGDSDANAAESVAPKYTNLDEADDDDQPLTLAERRTRLARLVTTLVVLLFIASVFFGRSWLLWFFNLQASTQLSAHRTKAALAWIDRARWVDFRDPEANFLLARAFRKQGETAKAQMLLKRAEKMGYESDKCERERILLQAQIGKFAEAQKQLPDLLLDPQGDEVHILEAFVSGYYLTRRLTMASEMLRAWELDFPNDLQARYMRGIMLRTNRESDDAKQAFREVITAWPEHYAAGIDLAGMLLNDGEYEEALTLLQQATPTPARRTDTLIKQANCLYMLEQEDEARELLQGILEEEPTSISAIMEMAKLEMEVKRPDAALRHLRSAPPQANVNADYRRLLSKTLNALGNEDEARLHMDYVRTTLEDLAKVDKLVATVSEHPEDADLRCRIGRLLLKCGNIQEGKIWVLSALDIDPNHVEARNTAAIFELVPREQGNR